MARVECFGRFWWCAVVAPLLVACGGTFTAGPDSSGSSAAGSGAGGGTGLSGGPSAGASGTSCAYEGKTYSDGERFPANDGCNSCMCHAGMVGCTLSTCSTGCQSGGQSYQPGQTFKLDCNTCTCLSDRTISCTEIACENQCAALQGEYAAVLKRAKACDPKRPDQCTLTTSGTVSCGCSTPVNASNTKALSELAELTKQSPPECITPCPPCLPPGPATCTAEGSCESAPFRQGEAACQVGGVVYPSGATGIPDPTSCNKCGCKDGQLSCTEIGCPIACPTGTRYGTQCAQCGPTDACQVVEHACLPSCTDACTSGFCSNGICRQICG
jgi:hypothetical protein